MAAALAGCAHTQSSSTHALPAAPPGALLHLVPAGTLSLDDDLPLPPLAEAALAQADLVERSTRVGDFHFGARVITRAAYAAALRRFAELARQAAQVTPAREAARSLSAAVAREFEVYEAVLPDPMLVTAYYEPVIEGARAPAGRFTQPLYRKPEGADYERNPGPSRAEIDSGHVLAGRGLELCFIDPLDAFVLQTEGSGVVALSDGTELALDFAATNGRPHVRIAPFLAGHTGKLGMAPGAQTNMHTIEAYLRTLPEPEMRAILEKNPRYVFFQPRPAHGAHPAGDPAIGPATSIGLPAVDGRVIATDPRFVPKGGLAFLETERPEFHAPTDSQPARWVPLHRFVLDADTGGGIKGARVDLYWGRGAEARLSANAMKRRGRLFYLAPRPE